MLKVKTQGRKQARWPRSSLRRISPKQWARAKGKCEVCGKCHAPKHGLREIQVA